MAERISQTLEFVVRDDIAPTLKAATQEVRTSLSTRFKEIEPRAFTETTRSLQRTGRLYVEKDVVLLNPLIVCEEMNYFVGEDHCVGEIQTNTQNLAKIQLDFDPLTETYAELTWGKYPQIKGSLLKDDYLDQTRDYVSWILAWKIDWQEIGDPTFSDKVFTIVLGFLKFLPKRLLQENTFNSMPIDDVSEELIPDPHYISPEKILIQKENLQELKEKLMCLPVRTRETLEKILSGREITTKERKDASEVLLNIGSFSKPRFVETKGAKPWVSKPKFGLVDASGTGLFAKVLPGQAFQLISWLTARQRYAVLRKIGYLEKIANFSAEQEAYSLHDAKDALSSMRNTFKGPNIPSFNRKLGTMISETRSEMAVGTRENTIGKNYFAVLVWLLSVPNAAQSLSGRQKEVAFGIASNKNINDIAAELHITRSTAYSCVFDIVKKIEK